MHKRKKINLFVNKWNVFQLKIFLSSEKNLFKNRSIFRNLKIEITYIYSTIFCRSHAVGEVVKTVLITLIHIMDSVMARPCWHCKLTKNIYSRTHITNAYLYTIRLYMYTSNCKIDSQFNTQIAYHLCLRLHCIRTCHTTRLYCIGKIFQHFFAIKFYIQSNYCYKRPQK